MKVIFIRKWSGQRGIPAILAGAAQLSPVPARMAVPLRYFHRFCCRGGLSFAAGLG
jgi:hypothetical protein